jgi:RNA polymerase sigma-70 factor (ECF subfamily)
LLARARDVLDADAWREFVQFYAPLLHGYFRRSSLPHHDASDLTQEVLLLAARALPGFAYDRARGQFRGWLRTVARNQMFKFFARSKMDRLTDGSSAAWRDAEAQPDDSGDDARWERDYRARLFATASEKVRVLVTAATWDAFWQTAVLGETAEAASRATGLSPGAVYVARCRVTARLRELMAELDRAWDVRP